MSYICVDAGTSGCKAAVVSDDGSIAFESQASYSFVYPQPGRVELDPADVWNAVLCALRDIAPYAGDARAIAVSSIGESLVIVDKDERALYNGILYLDERCVDTPDRIAERISEIELYETTGVPNSSMYSLDRLIWLIKNEPSVIENAKHIYLFGEYLTYMLSGVRAIDPATASRTKLFNVKTREWAKSVMSLFDIPHSLFSPIAPSGTVLGRVRGELARQIGLPETLKVVVGCHDQIAANLGSGITKPGHMLMGEGSTESFNLVARTDEVKMDKLFKYGMCMEPFPIEGRCLIPVGQLSHGTCIRWFVQQNRDYYKSQAQQGESAYQTADRLCADDGDKLYFIPYLSTVVSGDSQNRAPACFMGINASTDINTMYRALLEGLAFESLNILGLYGEAGVFPTRIVAAGGVTASAPYMQLKADTWKMGFEIAKSENAGVLGLSALCALGMGDIKDLDHADRFKSDIDRVYMAKRDYDAKFSTYKKILTAVKSLYAAL